ncbi:hypothetical protein EVAR_6279_1 [Eumeta japonica]|uniref:Uncharacterized protein n=1 Tax=Eumeta variegata TaxID=151549 RepID=A0A4C1TBN8_EUMVA|nr:hypothetical protein EVAR_6279_1 [Eumeta japonica]
MESKVFKKEADKPLAAPPHRGAARSVLLELTQCDICIGPHYRHAGAHRAHRGATGRTCLLLCFFRIDNTRVRLTKRINDQNRKRERDRNENGPGVEDMCRRVLSTRSASGTEMRTGLGSKTCAGACSAPEARARPK